ncbi:hypothetical protein A9R05_17060 [Burkholderia sp. KK1]|nr:hypothetical protein A9R05_17060 [Burkholderia sp. KK1]
MQAVDAVSIFNQVHQCRRDCQLCRPVPGAPAGMTSATLKALVNGEPVTMRVSVVGPQPDR